MRLTKLILGIFIQGDIHYETMEYWHRTFRLLAHPVLFAIYSMFAMGVTTEFIRMRWKCLVLAGVSGILLAVVTEAGKWNIPGRHFDLEEMWLNVAGVVVGVMIYLLVAKVFCVLCKKM